jgi:bifunctional DNA-binding transcriptional regulator/antitoxin component of YhaV-PrlF toxin-antitoxin module
MTVLTVTSKGQVTLKRDVLRHLGVKPGEKIEVDLLPDGKATISAETVRPGKISDLFGMLKKEGQKPLTLEEIKELIEDGWANRR